jgi:radical SAM protein with 4Fe4S-binding SPASM domain
MTLNASFLTLRPSLRLYPTSTGVVFFDRDPYEIEVRHIIRPKVALVLALFNGKRTVKQVANMVLRIFDCNSDTIKHEISRIVEGFYGKLLVDSTTVNPRWAALRPAMLDPREFLYKLEGPLEFGRAAFPYSLVYIVTNRCYRRCLYCYANASSAEGDEQWLSFKKLEILLIEMEQLGASMINFSGGDPFVRKDLPDIAILALEHGIFPWLSTKARVSSQVAQRLANAGLPLVQVSIDAQDREIQDYLCDTEGAYNDIVSTLETFLSAGVPLYTNTVVTAANIENVPKLVEWLLSLGVQMCILSPYARSLGRHSDKLFATKKQWISFLRWYERAGVDKTKVQLRYAQGLRHSLGVRSGDDVEEEETSMDHNACTGGREGFAVLPDGRVALCERLAYLAPVGLVGNLRGQSIKEVWNSEEMLRIVYPPRELFKGTVCAECPQFEACSKKGGRCYVRSWLVYGKLFAPDPLCPQAPPANKRVI